MTRTLTTAIAMWGLLLCLAAPAHAGYTIVGSNNLGLHVLHCVSPVDMAARQAA